MTASRWANIGADAGALHALIERIPAHVAPASIDCVWIFPVRRIASGESTILVVAAFDNDPGRRRVITARFTVTRNRTGTAEVQERIDEHGTAPASAVPRIVQGVLRRMGEDAGAEPLAWQIGGKTERWTALLAESGGRTHPGTTDTAGTDTTHLVAGHGMDYQ